MVTFSIKNNAQFNQLLDKVSKLGSSRFIMGEMARIVKKFNKANFTLKGSGQYKPLSAKYSEKKKRFKPSAPILVYSGDLRDSIGAITANSILKITALYGSPVFLSQIPVVITISVRTPEMTE